MIILYYKIFHPKGLKNTVKTVRLLGASDDRAYSNQYKSYSLPHALPSSVNNKASKRYFQPYGDFEGS
jgi:hypothetical protein